MKEKNKSLAKPSSGLLKKIVSKLDTPTSQELKAVRPLIMSSWPLKVSVFLVVLLLIAFATRITLGTNDDTTIVGTGLLLIAIAGFLFPLALNYIKTKNKL
ncbi:MAG: hypothetical protein AB8B73_10545 [Ekhidna sp.]